jgi:quinoprotein glucose dehydrogenase
MGGPVITAGGLVFIAATRDDYIRAFDLENGELVWKAALPAGGQATPMTYQMNGKQYIVLAAGGHGNLGTTPGDYVVAYALPE